MLKGCRISDGDTLHVTSRMRGGGRNKDKKSKAEKKRDRSPEKPEQTRGTAKQMRRAEEQVNEGLCAPACEQVRSIKEMTSEYVQRRVEKFEGLRMVRDE